MSNRTQRANIAIAKAWKNEQELVRNGQGTRNWTCEQQKDILSRGKAYDENGKAFQGHHKKSVEEYPEYQECSENIQFLTKKEHLAAHNGSFHNSTNGYYDVSNGQTISYGNDDPCLNPVINLSEPISLRNPTDESRDQEGVDSQCGKSSVNSKRKRRKTLWWEHLKASVGLQVMYVADHPLETLEAISSAVVDVASAVSTVQNVKSANNNPYTESIVQHKEIPPDISYCNISRTHSSPEEHTVKAHSQRYGKAKEWKEKAPYSRGGKREEA